LLGKNRRSTRKTLPRTIIAFGISTYKISLFLENLRGLLLVPDHFLSVQGNLKTSENLARKPPKGRIMRGVSRSMVFLLGGLGGKTAKEPVYITLKESSPMDAGRPWVLVFRPRGGKSAQNPGKFLKDLKRRGVQRRWIFLIDDLSGLEETMEKIFRIQIGSFGFCPVRDALNKAEKRTEKRVVKFQKHLPCEELERGEKACRRAGKRSLGASGFPTSSKAHSPLSFLEAIIALR
jgi:hypothetical protein